MPAFIYITTNEALVVHRVVLSLTDDPGDDHYREHLLESALSKPMWRAKYENADVVRQAASLAVGISQNQPFVTGVQTAVRCRIDCPPRVSQTIHTLLFSIFAHM